MKKILKSFFIAMSVTIILHLIALLVIYSLDKLDANEISETISNLPLSFSLFFFQYYYL